MVFSVFNSSTGITEVFWFVSILPYILSFMCIDVLQIDDDETVTMIDFPQMVSVSHRNAQMYVAYSNS